MPLSFDLMKGKQIYDMLRINTDYRKKRLA